MGDVSPPLGPGASTRCTITCTQSAMGGKKKGHSHGLKRLSRSISITSSLWLGTAHERDFRKIYDLLLGPHNSAGNKQPWMHAHMLKAHAISYSQHCKGKTGSKVTDTLDVACHMQVGCTNCGPEHHMEVAKNQTQNLQVAACVCIQLAPSELHHSSCHKNHTW